MAIFLAKEKLVVFHIGNVNFVQGGSMGGLNQYESGQKVIRIANEETFLCHL